MEKSSCVKVIERKEVRGDDPFKYILPSESEVLYEYQSPRMKRFLKGRMEGEKELVLLSGEEE